MTRAILLGVALIMVGTGVGMGIYTTSCDHMSFNGDWGCGAGGRGAAGDGAAGDGARDTGSGGGSMAAKGDTGGDGTDGGGDPDAGGSAGKLNFSLNAAVRRAIETYPTEKRAVVRKVYNELTALPQDVLYLLKATEPCSQVQVFDCSGLDSAEVKPFVEAALDRSKNRQTAAEAEMSRTVAVGSLVVSFLSLLVAFLAFRVKKREASIRS